ncbi:glyoxalase [Streptomyces sp. NBC_01803]|uniref:glyoxalase n=1 Tax=Streptomyces sp. NBC_01803 TaxID=2975946 RepID=UPI002DD81B0E|nr:glyoxalase [Streptomyces sp. NBC_01803]WSA44594.1 glyoxalase [Streptomyces sp. NBC_01803]
MITGLDHVPLAAPPGGEQRLRASCAGVLGMAEPPKPPALAARGGCWFAAGDRVLHLGIEAGYRPPGKAHPGILVAGIDAFAARLAAHGARVEGDGARVEGDGDLPGHRWFFSEAPVGNRLEFLMPKPPRQCH